MVENSATSLVPRGQRLAFAVGCLALVAGMVCGALTALRVYDLRLFTWGGIVLSGIFFWPRVLSGIRRSR
jgi:hypothetical protein